MLPPGREGSLVAALMGAGPPVRGEPLVDGEAVAGGERFVRVGAGPLPKLPTKALVAVCAPACAVSESTRVEVDNMAHLNWLDGRRRCWTCEAGFKKPVGHGEGECGPACVENEEMSFARRARNLRLHTSTRAMRASIAPILGRRLHANPDAHVKHST